MILDKIFEEKVGFGRSQLISVIFLGLVDFNDGAQLILSSFLTPVVQTEWGLTQNQISSLTAIFYLAIFVGAILGGRLSDQFGRRPMIIAGSVVQIIVSVFFLFVNQYTPMLIARGFYGFGYGFTNSITTSAFAEISPMKFRGKGMLFINFCVSIGKLYGLLLAYIFLDSFTSGNWRAMMVLSCLPNIIVFFGSLLHIRETPRFLIGANRIDEAVEVLDQMILANNSGEEGQRMKINQTEKEELHQYYQRIFQGRQQADFGSLFNQYYLRTTICLCFAWFSINFAYFGQLVVLPFIFGKQNKSFTSYALTVFGEIPSFLVSMLLVDRPNFGRKGSLKYFFFVAAIFHILFALWPQVIFSTLCRFFMKMCFQMIYPCTTESYQTLNRTLGYGFDSGVGRLGATIMPYVVLPLIQVSTKLIFVIFAVVCLVGSISSLLLPHQTMDRALDYKSESDQDEVIPQVNPLLNDSQIK